MIYKRVIKDRLTPPKLLPKYLLKYYDKLNNKNKKINFKYNNNNYTIELRPTFPLKKKEFSILKKEGKPIAIIGLLKDISNIQLIEYISGGKNKGTPTFAKENYIVIYSRNIIFIEKNTKIWMDDKNNIVIGWHGTFSPPADM